MGKEETKIQHDILSYLFELESLGYRVAACRTGVFSGRVKSGAYFKTGRVGWPDITACINGFFVGFEVKTKKGVFTKEQIEIVGTIEKSGGKTFAVSSIHDVIKICNLLLEKEAKKK